MRRSHATSRWLVLVAALALAAAACGGQGGDVAASAGCDGEIPDGAEIEIWWHEGAEAEVLAVESFVEEFNAAQDDVTASLTLVPEADYASSLRGAAAGGELPDVVDTDASFAFNYAWAGDLQPIDSCIPDELRDELLPSIVEQGTYADRMWAVGMFDSGLGMYSTRSALEEVGASIPTHPDEAWTVDEFDQILADLRDAGWERPLDVKKNYGQGEYYAYLYQPFVWSSGADVLAPDGSTADGHLNSEPAVAALTRFQAWHADGYVDDNEDDAAFIEGRSALSMVGHWEYNRYSETFGDDLVVVPLPDFGDATRTGQGSWQWAVSSEADADAAWAFIEFTLQPEQMERMSEASGALPSRAPIAEGTERFGPGGDLELFRIQLEEGFSVPRPPHPAYPTISSAFNQAIQEIIDGGDVQEALDGAVETIDADIEANEGYPPPETASS
ncbi:MAG TPA: extracellular solute-binding protein [Egibacteraceae bacterium]|nr:extracellular solute-binding protein [Egibacteraceae bacterium]